MREAACAHHALGHKQAIITTLPTPTCRVLALLSANQPRAKHATHLLICSQLAGIDRQQRGALILVCCCKAVAGRLVCIALCMHMHGSAGWPSMSTECPHEQAWQSPMHAESHARVKGQYLLYIQL